MTTLTRPYSIAEMIRDRATELGDNPVFTYQGKQLTYRALDQKSDLVAKSLLACGVQKGDRLAVLAKNSPVYFELIGAAAKIGAVVVPVNWRLAGPELTFILNDSGAKMCFLEQAFADSIDAIRATLEQVISVFVIDGEGATYQQLHQPSERIDKITIDQSFTDTADQEVVQLYTSGTTGKPKGAVLSSRMLIALRGQEDDYIVPEWQGYEIGETGLLVMPCFHVGGTSFGLGIIYNGAHSIVLPEYDQDEVVDMIQTFRVNKAFMVPAALQSLLNNPKLASADLNSLTHIYYGASPIPMDLMRLAVERLGCSFVQMYGMTETAGTIVALPPEDHTLATKDKRLLEKMSSVGKPLQGVELKIVNEQGDSLPVRNIGEIATRSQKNINAYWNRPDATNDTIDAEGWLRTGDAGFLDEDGYLYIRDRVKDMIISGGENIYPAEVENALYSHDAIKEVAVIGVPDERWGEAVKAVVVLERGQKVDADAIIQFSRERIAGYKCPKSIDFIAQLPRNAAGKVLRKDLRAPYWKGKTKAVN